MGSSNGRTKRSIERKNGQPGEDVLKAALFEMLASGGNSRSRGRGAESKRLGSQAESGGVVRTPRTMNKSQVLGDSWASLPSYDEKARQSREDPGSMSALDRMYFNQPFPRMWRDGEMGDARTLYEAPLNHAYLAAGTLGVAKEGAEDLARNVLKGIFGR